MTTKETKSPLSIAALLLLGLIMEVSIWTIVHFTGMDHDSETYYGAVVRAISFTTIGSRWAVAWKRLGINPLPRTSAFIAPFVCMEQYISGWLWGATVSVATVLTIWLLYHFADKSREVQD